MIDICNSCAQDFYEKHKEHVKSLTEQVSQLRAACQYIVDKSPGFDGPQKGACLWCDMGGAGYSSKGDGHHDDVRDTCPVLKCQEALQHMPSGHATKEKEE